MRIERHRKKKLIVAFHFLIADRQSANRTGWDCESCRRHGLEAKRRCGFIPAASLGKPTIVWGRRQVKTEACPRSLITGESMGLLEEFLVRRRLGIPDSLDMEARKVDAFLILREQMEQEERDGTRQH